MRADDFITWLLKIGTFAVLTFIIIMSSFSADWGLDTLIVSVILLLCAYTIILTMPLTKFKLGASGFEAELDRLTNQKEREEIEVESKEVEEVAELSEDLVEPDTILIRLSIEIETILRDIATSTGIKNPKVSMGMLVRYLQKDYVLTNRWLIDSLDFFRQYRNELLHEGKTDDIEKAIDLGREVLVHLKQIQKRYEK